MTTETQVVKELVAELRKRPGDDRLLRHRIHLALMKGDLPGYSQWWHLRRERQFMAERLERRIRKKLAQPFRRKKRGPLRKRASGKNEITRGPKRKRR